MSHLEGDRRIVAHLSERKEKKKKAKVVDITEHPGTQPEIIKVGREGNGLNGLESLEGPGIDSCDPEGAEKKKKRKRDRGDEEPAPADKKKKSKRDKVSEATTSEVKDKKKRRKSKSSSETSDLRTSVTGPAPGAISTGELDKPRKRKSTKGDAMDISVEAVAVPTRDRSSRKRKKLKQLTHPDPSDDPDLTEKAQKGSYPHSYFEGLTLLTSLFWLSQL